VLTDLTFLEKEKTWPPKSEINRLQVYAEAEALRAGQVNDIWPKLYKYLRDGTTAEQDFYLGFPFLITKKAIDTICGEPPGFGDIEDFIQTLNFRSVLREQIADLDAFGDSVQKIYKNGDGEVQIESIEPCNWFPIVKRGTRKIEQHVLAFMFEEKEKCYLEIEIHSKKDIQHRIYELNTGIVNGKPVTIGDQLPWESFYTGLLENEPNPAGDFLITTAHNNRMSGQLFGQSSYTPSLKSILKKLIIRYSLANNILDVFSRPTLVGPRNLETYDPVTGKSMFRPGEYKGIDFDPKVAPFIPQAVVWDGHLTEADLVTKALEEKLYIEAELPKAVLSMEATGVAASGVAWKLAMTPLLAKCARIREEIDGPIRQSLGIALKLANQNVDQISITWQDGLPDIPTETAQEFNMLANSPAFQGEVGIIWLLQNKLNIPEDEAKQIAADPSRGGGLGMAI